MITDHTVRKLNLQINCESQSLEALQNLQAEGDKESWGKHSMYSVFGPPSCMRWLLLIISAARNKMFHSVQQMKQWVEVPKHRGRKRRDLDRKRKEFCERVRWELQTLSDLLHYFQGRLPSRQIKAPPLSTRHEMEDFCPREIKWTREKFLTLRLIFHSFQVLSKNFNLILFS